MRQIIGFRRHTSNGELEEWVDWMIRTAHECEDVMREHGVPNWVEEVHRRKFRWAGRVARCEDKRWTREVMTWCLDGRRPRKRPLTRWSDSLRHFFERLLGNNDGDKNTWMILAKDDEAWRSLEDDYVNFILGRQGLGND